MLDIDTTRTTTAAPIASPQPRTPQDRISPSVVVTHGLAWVVALVVLEIIGPASDPEAVLPAYAVGLSLAFTVALAWTFFGLVRHERHGVWASMFGGGVMAVAAVTCGLEGHTELWVPTQLVMGIALVALSRRSLRNL